MPARLAARKWPSACTKTSMPITKAEETTVNMGQPRARIVRTFFRTIPAAFLAGPKP